MSEARKVFLHAAGLERYPYPPQCPFSTGRAGQLRRTLAAKGLLSGADRGEAVSAPADRIVLEKFHTAAYLDVLEKASHGEFSQPAALRLGLGTSDCPIFPGMYEGSALAAGATVEGARLILSGAARIAFNPSGGLHHAHAAMASGFCYVNDVVLGCMILAEAGRRVFFLDVDAHHADGVQEAFYDRADVMTVSFHESGWTLFPGTGFEAEIGVGPGRGYSVNVPLPPGTYDEAYMRAFAAIVPPLLEAYKPDAIVLEVGADALAGDPLTHLCLTNNVYADMALRLLMCRTPILVTGGGGYHQENTVRAWALTWAALCGDDEPGDAGGAMGGVMLGSTDWRGGLGLRDRSLAPDPQTRERVDRAVAQTVATLKEAVFPLHGL